MALIDALALALDFRRVALFLLRGKPIAPFAVRLAPSQSDGRHGVSVSVWVLHHFEKSPMTAHPTERGLVFGVPCILVLANEQKKKRARARSPVHWRHWSAQRAWLMASCMAWMLLVGLSRLLGSSRLPLRLASPLAFDYLRDGRYDGGWAMNPSRMDVRGKVPSRSEVSHEAHMSSDPGSPSLVHDAEVVDAGSLLDHP